MKKDVMNLETKIHNVKAYLRTQLKYVQENEQQLIKTINQHPNEFDTMRRQPKVKKMPYKEIVSSPVRVLINFPFKCTEVQQFQDFLMNSKNRYGGWIPYNHNIFEKLWHKYFSIQTNTEDIEYQEVDVENSELLPKFLQEMYEKNPEITVTELVAHCKWYSKYIYLKERQQRALEKWKTNRKLIKSSRQSAKTSIAEKKEEISDLNESKLNDAEDDDDINTLVSDEFKKLCNVFSEEIDSSSPKRVATDSQHETTMKKTVKSFRRNITEAISNRPCLAYRNYTEQWNNRCNDLDDCRHNYLNIENSSLTKRRIPAWRMVLNNE